MLNLIKDPQFYVLADILKEEAGLTNIVQLNQLITNNFKSAEEFLNLSSISESIFFKKTSTSSINDSFNLEELNLNNQNYALKYTANDSVSTVKQIYFPINDVNFNPKSYSNRFFTFQFDCVSSMGNIGNQSLILDMIISDGNTETILAKDSISIFYNTQYNMPSDPNFRKFKTHTVIFKTLKNATLFKSFSSDKTKYRIYLRATLPNPGSVFSINFANLILIDAKITDSVLVSTKHHSYSNLETKTKITVNKVNATNGHFSNDLVVDNDVTSSRDLSVGRNASIQNDLKVNGITKVSNEIQFYDSSSVFSGKISKVSGSVSDKFTFINSNGSRAELDAISLQARFADLSEYHKCSNDCDYGYLVQISKSDKYDVELCTDINKFIGVVSKNPCIKMNSALDDIPSSNDFKSLTIGYLGIINIHIKGKISKSDFVSLYKNGIGKKSFFRKTKIISLESSDIKEIKLIRCLVQC